MDMFGMMNDMIGNMVRLLPYSIPFPGPVPSDGWQHLESPVAGVGKGILVECASWIRPLDPESAGS